MSQYLETLVKTFKDLLRSGNWRSAQYALRFISDLVNCHVVSATSLLQLYDTFMEGAIDQTVPQVGGVRWFGVQVVCSLCVE
jgi:nuclear cap-binding protein subunit 1